MDLGKKRIPQMKLLKRDMIRIATHLVTRLHLVNVNAQGQHNDSLMCHTYYSIKITCF